MPLEKEHRPPERFFLRRATNKWERRQAPAHRDGGWRCWANELNVYRVDTCALLCMASIAGALTPCQTPDARSRLRVLIISAPGAKANIPPSRTIVLQARALHLHQSPRRPAARHSLSSFPAQRRSVRSRCRGSVDTSPAKAGRFSVLRRSQRRASPKALPEPLYIPGGVVVPMQARRAVWTGMPAN